MLFHPVVICDAVACRSHRSHETQTYLEPDALPIRQHLRPRHLVVQIGHIQHRIGIVNLPLSADPTVSAS